MKKNEIIYNHQPEKPKKGNKIMSFIVAIGMTLGLGYFFKDNIEVKSLNDKKSGKIYYVKSNQKDGKEQEAEVLNDDGKDGVLLNNVSEEIEINDENAIIIQLEEDELLTQYRVICEAGLNLRKTPMVSSDNKICCVNFDDIIYVYEDTINEQEDGRLWGLVEYYIEDKNELIKGYISMEDDYVEKYVVKEEIDNNIQLSSELDEVDITQDDIQKLINFTHTWENNPLCDFKKGNAKYKSKWVTENITKDGKYYICNTDKTNNGTRNYGFGVMINQYGEPNIYVCNLFKKYGYDVTDSKYLKIGESKLPVEVVDKVSEDFIINTVERVTLCAKQKNIKLSKSEILGLSAICYQFGNSENFINDFLNKYNKNIDNLGNFKNKYCTPKGTYVFKKVAGGSVKYEGKNINRGNAYWNAFYNGFFIMGNGEKVEIYENNKNEVKKADKNNNDSKKTVNDASFSILNEINWYKSMSNQVSHISLASKTLKQQDDKEDDMER